MREAKCPACRRRFTLDSGSCSCARCGADLSLLIKLRRHADRLAVAALSAPEISRDRLQEAQHICRTPEVRLLIASLSGKSS